VTALAPAPTVAAAFDAAVARHADTVAVLDRGRPVSYRTLAASVAQRADELPTRVGPGSVVGVRHRDPMRRVVATLAVVRRAAAVLPIDPDYPQERVRAMAASAGACWICADEDEGEAEHSAAAAGPLRQTPDSLAYVVSTSGSTGAPKAVGVPHSALLNLLSWSAAEYGLTAEDRLLPTHAPAFDASMRELLLPLLGGAALVLGAGDERFRPEALLDLVAAQRVTLLDMVPSLLGHVLDVPRAAESLRTVRAVTCGGEALPARLADRLGRLAPWIRLYNQYGPTETTVAVSSWCRPQAADSDIEPPIGRAVQGVSLHVLDEDLRPVPDGRTGELFVGGVALARGYLGRADLTAERFVPDPFGADGARLYRTGDLVRRRADGELAFVGRADDQVKVGGHRVEPGEVAGVLRAHPALADAVVVPVLEPGRRTQLAAYAVPLDAANPPSAGELRSWLAQRLPWFMVPAHLLLADRLPRTGTGKLDRAALPPISPEPQDAPSKTEPEDSPRALVRAAVHAVLGPAGIGDDTDFFAAGADSLQIHRIAARLAEQLGADISVQTAFGHRSINGLLDALARVPGATANAGAPIADEGAAELSFGQQRLWFLDQLAPGSPAYNVCAAYHITGPMDAVRLTAALRAVCERHELLRARVVLGAQGPRLVRSSAREVIPELAARPARDLEAELRELATRPFDLVSGPMLRADLLADDDGHILVIGAHHLVFDGLSAGPFLTALAAAYRAPGLVAGADPDSAREPATYREFVREQRAALTEARLAELLDFWDAQLDGVDPVLELPAARPRAAVPGGRAASVPVRLDPATGRTLGELARAGSVSLHTACLAVFEVLLARLTGRERFIVGTPAAGRPRTGFAGTVGFFVNTLPIVAEPAPSLAFTALLAEVGEVVRAALAHEDVPFERLVERAAPGRGLDRNPLVQVWFDLFSRPPVPDLDPGATAMSRIEVPAVATRFDVELHLEQAADGGIDGELIYADELFERSTALVFAEGFERIAQYCAAHPDAPVGAADPLTPERRETIVRVWNATHEPYDGPATVAEFFDSAVDAAPGAPALLGGPEPLGFRQLRDEARRLANVIDSRSRGRGVVAFALPHGPDAVTTLLAILLSGRPYLAIDVQTPPERAAFMIEASGATLVLSRSDCDQAVFESCDVLHLDALREELADAPTTAPPVAAGPDDLLYIMFTSGSTGRPKAVAMTHRPLLNLLAWQARRAKPTGPTLQFSALNFDISFQEMLATWGAGLPVVLLDHEQRRDPEAMLAAMLEYEVSTLFCPPPVLEALAQTARGAERLPPLDYIVTAGDALQLSEPVRALLGRLPGIRLDNQYGPTEAHVITGELLTGDPAHWPRFPRIGRPVANTAVYILDPEGRPGPPGVAGEVYVGGVCLAEGYLGRPDLTAERFLPDPFGPAGSRLYRTGDRARWGADGRAEFLGRLDHQVKIRGYRIEPGEIEAVLAAARGVGEAVVIAVGEGADRQLAAFVTPAPGAGPAPVEGVGDGPWHTGLRAALRAALPAYMVPATITPLPALPLTPAGKLDRKALIALEQAGPREAEPVAPRSPQEKLVAQIWSRCLGVAQIGLDEDFFEIGGHSLLATRVLREVRATFETALPIRAIFEHRTVRALTGAIEAAVLEEIAAMTDEVVLAAVRERAASAVPSTPTTEEEAHAHHQRS
jgi:amino acid adenylation domain-containing protein